MMSLDGFLEGPNRELDWHVVEPEFFSYAEEMLGSVDTILFGRTTFEMMKAYWPTAPADPIADKMNGLAKIVFSKSLPAAEWVRTSVVRGEATVEVARLKEQPGVDMVVLGSAALASSLLRAGQIDEYRVMVNPVILAQGNPMIQKFDRRMSLKLTGVRAFASDVVMLSYQP